MFRSNTLHVWLIELIFLPILMMMISFDYHELTRWMSFSLSVSISLIDFCCFRWFFSNLILRMVGWPSLQAVNSENSSKRKTTKKCQISNETITNMNSLWMIITKSFYFFSSLIEFPFIFFLILSFLFYY